MNLKRPRESAIELSEKWQTGVRACWVGTFRLWQASHERPLDFVAAVVMLRGVCGKGEAASALVSFYPPFTNRDL
jgi:hypothetical protein